MSARTRTAGGLPSPASPRNGAERSGGARPGSHGTGGVLRHLSTRALSVAMFAVISVSLLLAMMAGVHVFRTLRTMDEAVGQERLCTSLIAGAVRAADSADAVSVAEGPEGDMLVLAEHLDTGDYETRFYLHDGQILQEYALAGAELAPEAATPIARSRTFAAEYDAVRGLVRVSTDSGDASVALRSERTTGAQGDAGRSPSGDAGKPAEAHATGKASGGDAA